MKPAELTAVLESAAERLEIEIRYETLAAAGPFGSGGLCKVKGRWWLLIDKKATPAERAALIADALADFDTSALDLPRKAREMVEGLRGQKAPQGEPVPNPAG
jgi:hypothetical protein